MTYRKFKNWLCPLFIIASCSALGHQVADPKITQYDKAINFPQIVAGKDGTIHMIFEEAPDGLNFFVYYRSSKDGGKSWSAPKNLSEDYAGFAPGLSQLICDGQNRIYAIWKVGEEAHVQPAGNLNGVGVSDNLVYRALEGGAWSPIVKVNSNSWAEHRHQDIGMGAYYAGVDPNGKAHIAYSLSTDVFHPEWMVNYPSQYAFTQPGLRHGSVAEVDLNGGSCTKPREVFLSEVRSLGGSSKACDGFDLMTGYFDASGLPHFAAQTIRQGQDTSTSEIDLVAGGKQTKLMDLPQTQITQWPYPFVLLHDAQGKDHLILNYEGGDHHTIRDYSGGSFTILKNLAPVQDPLVGFQASQGPQGTMTLVVEASEVGSAAAGETWVNVFDGKAWRTSTQTTNFHKLSSGTYRATGQHSSVATVGSWAAGPVNAATIDGTGHFLLVYEGDQWGSFGVQGAGVQLVGGDSKSPKLFFHRY